MSSQAVTGGRQPLPLALRAYRAVMSLARPALWLVLRRRAERGKEDPARQAERYGIAGIPAGLAAVPRKIYPFRDAQKVISDKRVSRRVSISNDQIACKAVKGDPTSTRGNRRI